MTELDQRYAPGGDIYADNATKYGVDGAELIWRGYQRDGRQGAAIAAGNLASPGVGGSTSTLAIFAEQLVTDPLAAPLESANNQIGKAVWNVVKNPFVLLALGLVLFLWLGGANYLRKQLANAK